MSLLVKHIPPQNISSVWDIVEPFIQDALEKGSESKDHSLDYNSSHVQLYLSKGEWMLLVANGFRWPNQRLCYCFFY